MPQLTEATAGLPLPAELLVTESYPGAPAHSVLLVRPDGHLVAAVQGHRPEELFDLADKARSAAAELPVPRSATGSGTRERLTAGQSR
jgi:3-(3-hydroxy-phenyl)propionate hydroxylase